MEVKHAAATAAAKSLQSCSTLCDPTDGSPADSPVPGILKAIEHSNFKSSPIQFYTDLSKLAS